MSKPSTSYANSALLVGILATLACVGCGYKGPLYRTDASGERIEQPNSSPVPRKKSPFSRIPAPQAQKEKQPQQDSSGGAPGDTPPAVDPDRPATPTPTTPP